MENKEIESVTQIVPREVLVKQGTSAAIHLVGGLFLLIMTFGARSPVLGLVLSAVALVIGAAALFSRSREDRTPGLVIAAAGALGLAVRFGPPLLRPFAAFALALGAIGLFARGIVQGVKFLRGLKSRQ
jgi:hypothetical protein